MRGLDYASERWVRVYTRDTAEWLALPWQARAVYLLLKRKVDRAGRLTVSPRLGLARSMATLVDAPLEVIEAGLDGLLELGWLTVDGDHATIVDHAEADTATATPAARKRLERERARAGVTKRDRKSRGVTGVTPGHDASPLSDPIRSKPIQAEPDRSAIGDRAPVHADSAALAVQSRGASLDASSSPPVVVSDADPPDTPGEVASLPLRLMPTVDPDPRGWRRKQARRLWDWHEHERIARLHGGRGEPRRALDEHLDAIERLVRKVAKQEGIDDHAAFLRVRDFRSLALDQARMALADGDPEWARKLVRWARNDSAWSIKAYDSIVAGRLDAVAVASTGRAASPPGTVDGEPLTAVEVTAWQDAYRETGDTTLARMAVLALRAEPVDRSRVIDVTARAARAIAGGGDLLELADELAIGGAS